MDLALRLLHASVVACLAKRFDDGPNRTLGKAVGSDHYPDIDVIVPWDERVIPGGAKDGALAEEGHDAKPVHDPFRFA